MIGGSCELFRTKSAPLLDRKQRPPRPIKSRSCGGLARKRGGMLRVPVALAYGLKDSPQKYCSAPNRNASSNSNSVSSSAMKPDSTPLTTDSLRAAVAASSRSNCVRIGQSKRKKTSLAFLFDDDSSASPWKTFEASETKPYSKPTPSPKRNSFTIPLSPSPQKTTSSNPVTPATNGFRNRTPILKSATRERTPIRCPSTPRRSTPKSPALLRPQMLYIFTGTHHDISPNRQRFVWGERLGSGSFGEVFSVRDLRDGQVYAVKKSLERLTSFGQREQMISQMRSVDSLGIHPHTLRHHCCWQEGGFVYIQTELCQNGNLDSYLHKKLEMTSFQLTEKEVCRYINQIAMGLQLIHSKGLIHMDVKPTNIYVDTNGNLKIGDFGLCIREDKYIDGDDGDSSYMAPEVLEGNVSSAVDIFALGITMYELISDEQLPSHGPRWRDLRQKEIEFSSSCLFRPSKSLGNLVRAMMRCSASDRPSAASILNHHLIRPFTRENVHLQTQPSQQRFSQKLSF